MTANQIAYQANLETQRANKAKERENYRANRAQEELTKARDFSKAPMYYTLYTGSNTHKDGTPLESSSAVNVVARSTRTNDGTNLTAKGAKSIFAKAKDWVSKELAKGIRNRNERNRILYESHKTTL